MEEDDLEAERDVPPYARREAVDRAGLRRGLGTLALFQTDPNMTQQAFNLNLIDDLAMQLEEKALRNLVSEESQMPDLAFLSAISQMWIFAAYELLRTWRQRAGDIVKWADNGGLQTKLDQLRKPAPFAHFGKEIRARQIEQVMADAALLQKLRDDLKRIYMPFAQLESLRVSIAKHEVRGRDKSAALMPTYGRINRWCGSLDFELSHDAVVLETISRRDVADAIRAIPSLPIPSAEDLASFNMAMRGPTAEELAELFAKPPEST